MSKKYVPSFLKDQSAPSNPTTNTSTSFWPGQKPSTSLSSSNKFDALSDDFHMKKDKPIINTSLPAKEAPKLAPATLASITGGGATTVGNNSGPKKSFASKFAEQAKIAADPYYKPPPKPIDVTSENDFPSLGGPAKPATGAWGSKPKNETVQPEKTALSFADKAKEWAKKKEEEEEEARQKAIEEEKRRREADLHKRMNVLNLGRFKRQYVNEDDEGDEYYNNEESSLGDDDSYEVPEGDGEPSEEEEDEDNDEFNLNVGWDGRRRDDLY